MERRFCPSANVRIERADGDSEATRIVGHGAVFYDGTRETEYELWPGTVERIMPGAFDRAIREKDDIRGLFNHNPDNVLGRRSSGTMSVTVDKRGLVYNIAAPDTEVARSLISAIERGDVSGSSFSFRVTGDGQTWREEELESGHILEIREITDFAAVFDAGPVVFPAYEGTDAGLRMASDGGEAKSAYEAWKSRRSKSRTEAFRREARARLLEIEISA